MKSATLNTGNLMSTKQNPQNNNRNIPLSLTKWLNKLTSLLSKKGQEFLSLGHWSLPSETNVRKEGIYIN